MRKVRLHWTDTDAQPQNANTCVALLLLTACVALLLSTACGGKTQSVGEMADASVPHEEPSSLMDARPAAAGSLPSDASVVPDADEASSPDDGDVTNVEAGGYSGAQNVPNVGGAAGTGGASGSGGGSLPAENGGGGGFQSTSGGNGGFQSTSGGNGGFPPASGGGVGAGGLGGDRPLVDDELASDCSVLNNQLGNRACVTELVCDESAATVSCNLTGDTWRCECPEEVAGVQFEVATPASNSLCEEVARVCLWPEETPLEAPVCDTAVTASDDSCETVNDCEAAGQLADGVQFVEASESYVSCRADDGEWNCRCGPSGQRYAVVPDGTTACDAAAGLCADGGDFAGELVACNLGTLTTDGESCSAELECRGTVTSPSLDGDAWALMPMYIQCDASDAGAMLCECAEARGSVRVVVPRAGAGPTLCLDIAETCDLALAAAFDDAEVSCDVGDGSASTSRCQHSTLCAKSVSIESGLQPTSVEVLSEYRVECRAADSDSWDCGCRSGAGVLAQRVADEGNGFATCEVAMATCLAEMEFEPNAISGGGGGPGF